jgi:hypothetical protein
LLFSPKLGGGKAGVLADGAPAPAADGTAAPPAAPDAAEAAANTTPRAEAEPPREGLRRRSNSTAAKAPAAAEPAEDRQDDEEDEDGKTTKKLRGHSLHTVPTSLVPSYDPDDLTIDKVLDHRLAPKSSEDAAADKAERDAARKAKREKKAAAATNRRSRRKEDAESEEEDDDSDSDEAELIEQYLIKWQGFSDLHDTWEEPNDIAGCKGILVLLHGPVAIGSVMLGTRGFSYAPFLMRFLQATRRS